MCANGWRIRPHGLKYGSRNSVLRRTFPRWEREAIALAQELQVPLLLMDDPAGREEATRRALRTTGTLGILEQAAIEGLLNLPTVLDQLLTTTTFRAGATLIQGLLDRDAARKADPPTDGR